jgi:hypothetical protein
MSHSLLRILSLIFATFLASEPLAAPTVSTTLYAVVFEVTVNSSGKLNSLKISKVIDPRTGSTDAIDLPVPEEYVKAVQEFLSKRTYDTKDEKFFTYTFYDPSQPSKADIDPQAPKQ